MISSTTPVNTGVVPPWLRDPWPVPDADFNTPRIFNTSFTRSEPTRPVIDDWGGYDDRYPRYPH